MDQDKIEQFRQQQAQQAAQAEEEAKHQEVVGSLNNLLLATMVSKDPKMVEVAQNLGDLLAKIGEASQSFEGSSLHLLPIANQELAVSVQDLADRIEQYSPHDLAPYFEALVQQLDVISQNKPVVNVPKQPVTVDLQPLISALNEVKKEVAKNKIDIPKTDMTDVIKGLKDVQKTIGGLSFPTPNYVLPFKNTAGAATQVQLDSSGNLPVSATFTPSGTQDVNITKVAGAAISQGHGTAASAIRVELPTDGTGVVTANAGTNLNTSALALAATQTDKSQFTKITDGTDTALVTAAGEQNVIATAQPGVDIGDVTVNNASGAAAVNIQDGGNSITVDGTVTADTELPTAAALSDGDSSTPTTTTVGAFNMIANAGASAANRMRGMGNGLNSTGTGLAAAGMIAQFDDVAPTSITENSFGNVRISQNRNLYGTIRDAAGNERGLNIDANGALAATVTNATAANLKAEVTGATSGSGTATGAIRVELPTNGTGVVGLNTGTNSIGKITDITASVVPGTAATNLGKAEDAGHTTGDTGVFTLGVRNDTVADATNANSDYSQISTDVKGHILTADAPRALKGRQVTTITSSTAETTIVTAVASTFLDIYRLVVTNTSATACKVTIKDSTAGTTVWVWNIPAGDSRGFAGTMDAAATQTTVNNNWTLTCGSSVDSIVATAEYVKNI